MEVEARRHVVVHSHHSEEVTVVVDGSSRSSVEMDESVGADLGELMMAVKDYYSRWVVY